MTILRAALAVALAVGILALPLASEAQPAGKSVVIGVLSPGSPSSDPGRQAFLKQLQDLGWVVGQNLTIQPRYAEGKLDRLPDLAAELVQHKMSLIVAVGTPASLAAKHATATIPIVILAGDPVGTGLVASLARPGGNITGLTSDAGLELAELGAKRLELLKEATPKISRVGILSNPSNPAEARATARMPALARTLGLTFLPLEVRSPGGFDSAFAVLSHERADALIVVENSLNFEQRQLIIDFAARNRLPTVFGDRVFADAGGLMSYGTDWVDLLRRTATYIDKILKGAKPADLPVEQPTKFELVINMKTARALGLTIPQSLLLRADQVIE
jgi:putative ABC transport system substrate-binding protein